MFGVCLKNELFMTTGLQRPYLVIENALEPEFAERLRTDLLTSRAWRARVSNDRYDINKEYQDKTPSEYSFSRDAFKMNSPSAPQSVKELYKYLNSDECLRWICRVSGRQCNAFDAACARYLEGNYLTRHNDQYSESNKAREVTTRSVTFNYYLTKVWKPEWGGRFVWENPRGEIAPAFNTLVMFLVGPDSMHHVEKVNESATEPRLAVTGWFTTTRKRGSRKLYIGGNRTES